MTAAFCSVVNARPALPSWWARWDALPLELASEPEALADMVRVGDGRGGRREVIEGSGWSTSGSIGSGYGVVYCCI